MPPGLPKSLASKLLDSGLQSSVPRPSPPEGQASRTASLRAGAPPGVQLQQPRPGALDVARPPARARRPARARARHPGPPGRAGRPPPARRGCRRRRPSRGGPGRARGGSPPAGARGAPPPARERRASRGSPLSRISKASSACASAWSAKRRTSSCSRARAPGEGLGAQEEAVGEVHSPCSSGSGPSGPRSPAGPRRRAGRARRIRPGPPSRRGRAPSGRDLLGSRGIRRARRPQGRTRSGSVFPEATRASGFAAAPKSPFFMRSSAKWRSDSRRSAGSSNFPSDVPRQRWARARS